MNNDNTLPAGWTNAKIGENCQNPEYGFTESAVAEKVGPKFLRITDITERGVNWDTVPYCRCPESIFQKYELQENDLLFARIGATTGKSYIVKNPPQAVFASYLIRLRPLEGVNPDYLYYFFNSNEYWNQINANKSNNLKGGVNSSILSNIHFPLPSKDEQQKIAAILFKIQQAIEIQESIIEKTRELKKSTLHHVFTHGLHGEKLKETEIGPMPDSWNIIKIEDCCGVRSSTISFNELNQGRSENNDVRCHAIKVSDMNLPGNEKYVFAANIETELLSKHVSEKAIPANSVIFPKRGAAIATNKKRITTIWSVLDPNLIAVIPRTRVTSEFLYYWFLTFDLASIQDLGPTPQLNKKDVDPISIPCPSDKEQLEIVKILCAIDQKLILHTAKKSVLQDLFKTMLNKLMTGEIRVKDLDINVSEVSA